MGNKWKGGCGAGGQWCIARASTSNKTALRIK